MENNNIKTVLIRDLELKLIDDALPQLRAELYININNINL